MTPLEIVHTFISALEQKDVDAALAFVADDIEYDNVPMATIHGREDVRTALAGFLKGASEVEWIVYREAANGNVVFNERLDRFHIGDKWLEIAVVGVWELHDGKIALWRDYFDLGQLQSQMS
jgi:limonene-1,2-epoxide hydrolase